MSEILRPSVQSSWTGAAVAVTPDAGSTCSPYLLRPLRSYDEVVAARRPVLNRQRQDRAAPCVPAQRRNDAACGPGAA